MNTTDTDTEQQKTRNALATLASDLLSPGNLIKIGGLVFTIATATWALAGKMAVSEAKLSDHGTRLGLIESDLSRKTVRDARSDQKLDDLINTMNEIKAGVNQLNAAQQEQSRGRGQR